MELQDVECSLSGMWARAAVDSGVGGVRLQQVCFSKIFPLSYAGDIGLYWYIGYKWSFIVKFHFSVKVFVGHL